MLKNEPVTQKQTKNQTIISVMTWIAFPPKRYDQVLILGTQEGALIWNYGFCRAHEGGPTAELTSLLPRRGKSLKTQTDRQEDIMWSKRQMQLHLECQGLMVTAGSQEEAKKGFSAGFRRSLAGWHQTSILETIPAHCFKPPRWWSCVTATLGNWCN